MAERTHVAWHDDQIVLEAREQPLGPRNKPKGFWYEVAGDWRRWASSEMPHWIRNGFLHRVEPGDERLLRITSAGELDEFDEQYGALLVPGALLNGIRWSAVAAIWDGIEIAPYIWERRLDGPSWYYGWDCASGCIWRPRGASVHLVGPAETGAVDAEAAASWPLGLSPSGVGGTDG